MYNTGTDTSVLTVFTSLLGNAVLMHVDLAGVEALGPAVL